jgi:hypothetical protein
VGQEAYSDKKPISNEIEEFRFAGSPQSLPFAPHFVQLVLEFGATALALWESLTFQSASFDQIR